MKSSIGDALPKHLDFTRSKERGSGVLWVLFVSYSVEAVKNKYHAHDAKVKRYKRSIEDIFKGCNVVRVCFSNRQLSY